MSLHLTTRAKGLLGQFVGIVLILSLAACGGGGGGGGGSGGGSTPATPYDFSIINTTSKLSGLRTGDVQRVDVIFLDTNGLQIGVDTVQIEQVSGPALNRLSGISSVPAVFPIVGFVGVDFVIPELSQPTGITVKFTATKNGVTKSLNITLNCVPLIPSSVESSLLTTVNGRAIRMSQNGQVVRFNVRDTKTQFAAYSNKLLQANIEHPVTGNKVDVAFARLMYDGETNPSDPQGIVEVGIPNMTEVMGNMKLNVEFLDGNGNVVATVTRFFDVAATINETYWANADDSSGSNNGQLVARILNKNGNVGAEIPVLGSNGHKNVGFAQHPDSKKLIVLVHTTSSFESRFFVVDTTRPIGNMLVQDVLIDTNNGLGIGIPPTQRVVMSPDGTRGAAIYDNGENNFRLCIFHVDQSTGQVVIDDRHPLNTSGAEVQIGSQIVHAQIVFAQVGNTKPRDYWMAVIKSPQAKVVLVPLDNSGDLFYNLSGDIIPQAVHVYVAATDNGVLPPPFNNKGGLNIAIAGNNNNGTVKFKEISIRPESNPGISETQYDETILGIQQNVPVLGINMSRDRRKIAVVVNGSQAVRLIDFTNPNGATLINSAQVGPSGCSGFTRGGQAAFAITAVKVGQTDLILYDEDLNVIKLSTTTAFDNANATTMGAYSVLTQGQTAVRSFHGPTGQENDFSNSAGINGQNFSIVTRND